MRQLTALLLGLFAALTASAQPSTNVFWFDKPASYWEEALPVGNGRIVVSLRKSVTDGFWDIVVEDNGPGVSDEHVEKLFTPNFTTKNGGSGLGLAISRSILERCGATISYSKSFTLGGACFTVRYPDNDKTA